MRLRPTPLGAVIAAGATLALAASAGRAWSQEPPAPAPAPQSARERTAEAAAPPTLEELQQLLGEQRQLIARQQEALAALEQRLAQVESLALSSSNRLAELEHEAPAASVPSAVEQRLASLEQSVQKLPEFTDTVTAGEFPGSLRIPGTDAALKIGGQVTFTTVNSLTALGTDDRFVTSSIPIAGTEAAGKTSRLTYSARPSRLNFDLRTPTGVGNMRVFVEADYAGDANAFRLRHAFGQWRRLVIGQTWSTFADPEAEPDGIDFEGLNAIALFRQPQIRWTTSLTKRLGLAVAAENPRPDVTGASGVSQVPDGVLRLRWEPEGLRGPFKVLRGIGHLQGGVLIRQIRAEPPDQPNTTLATAGYGFNLSGRLNPGWWNDKDDVTLAVYAGKGIGRYVTDLGTLGGQDAVYDPAANDLRVLPVFSSYLGYQHWWSDTVRSTLTWGAVWVDNLDIQPEDALKQTQRFSLNVAWSPIPRIDLVGEFLAGHRINKDRQRGTARQFQFGTRFRF